MPIIHSMIPGHTGTFTINDGHIGYLAGHMNMSSRALDVQPWTIITLDGSTTYANVALYPNGHAPDGVVLYRHLSEIRDLPPEFSLVLEPIPANTTTTELPFIAGMIPTPIEPPSPAPTNLTIESAPQRVDTTPNTTNLTRTNIPQPPTTTPEATAEEELPIPIFLRHNTNNVTHIPDIQATPMPENIPGLIGMTVNIPGHEGAYYSGSENLEDIINAAGVSTETLNSHPWSIIKANGEEKRWIFSDLIQPIHAERQRTYGVDTIDQMMSQGYQIYDYLDEAINNDVIHQGSILTLNSLPDIPAPHVAPVTTPANPTTTAAIVAEAPRADIVEIHGMTSVTLVTPMTQDTYYLNGNTLGDLFDSIDAEAIVDLIGADIEDCIIAITDANNHTTRYAHEDYAHHHLQRDSVNNTYECLEEFEEKQILSQGCIIEFAPPNAITLVHQHIPATTPVGADAPTMPTPTISPIPTNIPEIPGVVGVTLVTPNDRNTYYLTGNTLNDLFLAIDAESIENLVDAEIDDCIINITDTDNRTTRYGHADYIRHHRQRFSVDETYQDMEEFEERHTLYHNYTIEFIPPTITTTPESTTTPIAAPISPVPDYIPGLMAITVELPGHQGTYYVTHGHFSEFLRESGLTMDRLRQFAWTVTYPDGVTKIGHQIISYEDHPDGAADLSQHGMIIRGAPLVAS